ncbi:hypothetical protein ACS0TY_005727 [Phlomoides rotata]
MDPNMKDMWSYFPDWLEIFGLDRATSSVAEDVVEMAKRLKQLYGKPPPVEEVQECDGANFRSDGDQQPPSEGIYGTQTNDPTKANSTANGKNNNAKDKACGSKKKRKLNSELTGNSNIECILGLSIKDKLKASVLIGGKVEYLEIWSTLPDEARSIYVNEVLGLKDKD